LDAVAEQTTWAAVASKAPRTLAGQAFDALHTAIVNGDIAPGERLPIEKLATMLGMSHLPIREAIRQLESVGLVAHVPHRGASVAPISLDDLRQLYEARLLVEPAIVAIAARSFTEADATAAAAALERQAEAEQGGVISEIWAAHTEFHFALYRASRATWLLRLAEPLWNSSQRYRMTIAPLSSQRRRREAHREHKQLLAACVEGDAEDAALVLHNHLVKTANLITDQMNGEHVFALR
jgi:DNA-binding GntR family transcriptional regulator